MFPPIFPIHIEALTSLYDFAPLVWLSGVVCLGLTRYTHQLAKRWGPAYYVLSALVRPVGILLIAIGWLALYAPAPSYWIPGQPTVGWLPTGNLTEILCCLAIGAFLALGVWSVLTLGLRRSFLFRRLEDGLVTHGPYALVRHPQFLSAIGIAFFGVMLFNPAAFPFTTPGAYYQSLEVNWALFTLSLWMLSIIEDHELATHFGKEYEDYAQRVARLFPN